MGTKIYAFARMTVGTMKIKYASKMPPAFSSSRQNIPVVVASNFAAFFLGGTGELVLACGAGDLAFAGGTAGVLALAADDTGELTLAEATGTGELALGTGDLENRGPNVNEIICFNINKRANTITFNNLNNTKKAYH